MHDIYLSHRPNGPRKYFHLLCNPIGVLRHNGHIINADVGYPGTKVSIGFGSDRPHVRKGTLWFTVDGHFKACLGLRLFRV